MSEKEEDILKISTLQEFVKAHDVTGGKPDGKIDVSEAPKFAKDVFKEMANTYALITNEVRRIINKKPLEGEELEEFVRLEEDHHKKEACRDDASRIKIMVDAAEELGLKISKDAANAGMGHVCDTLKPHDTPARHQSFQHSDQKGRH